MEKRVIYQTSVRTAHRGDQDGSLPVNSMESLQTVQQNDSLTAQSNGGGLHDSQVGESVTMRGPSR